MQGLSKEKALELRNVRMVPVANATLLAAPSRLFTRLRQDLAPFAFELPPEYTPYVTMLKAAGCRDSPTSADLLQILRVRLREDLICIAFHFGEVEGCRSKLY